MSAAAAATAVGLVAQGVAASTTAATVAAGAFIGSSTALAGAAIVAAGTSNSLRDFYDQGSWGTVTSVAGGALLGGFDGYGMYGAQNSQGNTATNHLHEHKSGRSNPKKNPVPNGSYTQYDDFGDIYSYAQYDGLGRQTLRIDFQGKPHNGVLPHIHLYAHRDLGKPSEYVFDLMWNLIG